MDSWAVLALEIERNQLPLAEEHAAAADRAYRSGLSDLQTVLRAQEERIRLAEARINALRDYHLARTEYKASLGIP
jgi:outer membrane protein TolC